MDVHRTEFSSDRIAKAIRKKVQFISTTEHGAEHLLDVHGGARSTEDRHILIGVDVCDRHVDIFLNDPCQDRSVLLETLAPSSICARCRIASQRVIGTFAPSLKNYSDVAHRPSEAAGFCGSYVALRWSGPMAPSRWLLFYHIVDEGLRNHAFPAQISVKSKVKTPRRQTITRRYNRTANAMLRCELDRPSCWTCGGVEQWAKSNGYRSRAEEHFVARNGMLPVRGIRNERIPGHGGDAIWGSSRNASLESFQGLRNCRPIDRFYHSISRVSWKGLRLACSFSFPAFAGYHFFSSTASVWCLHNGAP